jgi:hypothetical protein
MNRPRLIRGLRITWTVFCGSACVVLVVLWGLVAICVRMMEKKPQYRYQSAEELISAINAWKAEGR